MNKYINFLIKLQLLFLLQLFSEVLTSDIQVYLYCIGSCTGQTESGIPLNLDKNDPPFEPYPPVYTKSYTTQENKLKFEVEDIFFKGISGHITVDRFSFYIGLSSYFTIHNSWAEIEFYEKNEPKILQYAYVNAGVNTGPILVEFTIPTGDQLYDAQFPLFKDNCFKNFSHFTSSPKTIDFCTLFNPALTTKTVKFPSNFPGTVNGTVPSESPLVISPVNSNLSISLNANESVTVFTSGEIRNQRCQGYIIISSKEPKGCETYDANEGKCIKCYDGFYVLDENGICRAIIPGYYVYKEQYHKCYKSCKTCLFRGNEYEHNCEECDSIYPYRFKPDYWEHSFCYESCGDGGLVEYFSPERLNHCVLGCRIYLNYLNYEDNQCILKNKTLAFGLYALIEEKKAVKECPPQYPYYQINLDEEKNFESINCVKQCNLFHSVYKYDNKYYCTQYCPEDYNYIRDGNVCGQKDSEDYYLLTLPFDSNDIKFYYRDCNNFNSGWVNYESQGNKICNLGIPENSYEIFEEGKIKKYVDSCNNQKHNNGETKICTNLDKLCPKSQYHKYLPEYSFDDCVSFCNSTETDPYSYDYHTKICEFNCNSYKFKILENELFPNAIACVNSCPIEYPYSIDRSDDPNVKNLWCVKQCDIDYCLTWDNECVKFGVIQYFDSVTNKWTNDIGARYLINNTNILVEKCSGDTPYLYVDGSNVNGVCVERCPENASFVEQMLNKCVSKCPRKYVFRNYWTDQNGIEHKDCVSSCWNSGFKRIKNYECVTDCEVPNKITDLLPEESLLYCRKDCEEVSNYCIEKMDVNLNDAIIPSEPEEPPFIPEEEGGEETEEEEQKPIKQNYTEFLPAFNAYIKDTIFSPFTKNETIYENFTFQRYPIDEPYELTSNSTSFSLGECADLLKNTYKTETLYIFKGELFRKDSHINQVEYRVYNSAGEELDLSICKKITVSLQYTLNEYSSVDIDQLTSMLIEHGIDIFNISSPFYSDICFSFSTKDGRDIVLKDRQEIYYPNISLCDTGCEYGGIDPNTLIVTCNCDIKLEVNDKEVPPTNPKYFTSLYDQTNLWLFKCYKVFLNFKGWKRNWGFYLIGILESLTVLMLLCFLCTFSSRKLSLITRMVNKKQSPPRRKVRESRSFDSSQISPIISKERSSQSKVEELIIYPSDAYDIIPFKVAVKTDTRKFGQMFFDIFFSKVDTLQLICFKKEFAFVFISFSAYFFSLLLEFTMNAFLFSDDIISETYHNNGKMSMFKRIFLSSLSNLISNAVTFIVFKFIKYEEIIEKFASEVGNETKKILAIKRYFNYLKCRIFLFYLLNLILSAIFFYFIIIFCTIYPYSQYHWVKDCFTAMVLEFCKSIVKALFIGTLRYIAIKFGYEKFYYISIYFNNWNCIISL